MRNRWSILKESQLFVNILFIQWRTKVPNSHDLCYFIVYPLCLLSGEREREFLRSLSAMEDTFLRMQVTKQRQSKLDEFFQEADSNLNQYIYTLVTASCIVFVIIFNCLIFVMCTSTVFYRKDTELIDMPRSDYSV